MTRVLILYYSGVGNTRLIAEYMRKYMSNQEEVEVELYSVEHIPKGQDYEKFDGLIIGFPTIHCSPAERIVKYLDSIEKIGKNLPTFIYTTCGLYQANTTRIFAKMCREKNMIPIMDASYRMPAVDGMLLTDKWNFIEKSEKRLKERMERGCTVFLEKVKTESWNICIPTFKWYSILNYPNKLVGKNYVFPIYLNAEKCIGCNKCVQNCPSEAWKKGEKHPSWNKSACERCYRCIHNCPQEALSLKKQKGPARIWKPFEI